VLKKAIDQFETGILLVGRSVAPLSFEA